MADKIVKNAVRCTICQSPADLINGSYYQCQKNKCHLGDTFVGIFSDLDGKETPATGLAGQAIKPNNDGRREDS